MERSALLGLGVSLWTELEVRVRGLNQTLTEPERTFTISNGFYQQIHLNCGSELFCWRRLGFGAVKRKELRHTVSAIFRQVQKNQTSLYTGTVRYREMCCPEVKWEIPRSGTGQSWPWKFRHCPTAETASRHGRPRVRHQPSLSCLIQNSVENGNGHKSNSVNSAETIRPSLSNLLPHTNFLYANKADPDRQFKCLCYGLHPIFACQCVSLSIFHCAAAQLASSRLISVVRDRAIGFVKWIQVCWI